MALADQTTAKTAGYSTGFELAEEMRSRRPISAWLMSLFTHASLFVLLGLTWKMMPKDAFIESDRRVGIVLVHQQEGKKEYSDPLANDLADDQSAASALSQAMPNANEVPVDLSEALPGASPLTAGGLADSILDATQLTGNGSLRRGGQEQGASTKVFGITGVGTKFVYVFDRSGSMENYGGRPLRAAKMELNQSLEDLDSVHQFQIIFYNNDPQIFQPHPGKAQLLWGDTESKTLAREFVNRIRASGGTEHLKALQKALEMRPDVIFFLTDADQRLTFGELQRVQSWNRGTTIHAIEFGAGPRLAEAGFLLKLAQQNGGQHAYIDVRLLRDNP